MNSFDLAASLFQSLVSLAWPAAIIVCVYLFRGKLNELLPRLHLKHKETEIWFPIHEALEAAKGEAVKLPAPDPNVSKPTEEEAARYIQTAKISPKAAILGAWSDLEIRLRESVRGEPEFQSDLSSRTSALNIMRRLRAAGLISSVTFNLFNDLRTIRNQVAHNDYPDGTHIDDAVAFFELMEKVLSAIESIPSYEEQAAALGIRN